MKYFSHRVWWVLCFFLINKLKFNLKNLLFLYCGGRGGPWILFALGPDVCSYAPVQQTDFVTRDFLFL